MDSTKNQKRISQLFTFLSVVFGVFIICLSLFFWMQLEAYQDRQASERISAAKYNDSNYNEHYQWCIEIPDVLERVNCLTKQKEAQQESKRSKYDLRAQQEMSQWALGMLFASIIALFLNVVGVFAIILTLRETRKMTGTTQEIGQKQVRAYLSSAGGEFCVHSKQDDDGITKHTLVVRPLFKNSGQSPALSLRSVHFDVTISASDSSARSVHLTHKSGLLAFTDDIAPGETENACEEFEIQAGAEFDISEFWQELITEKIEITATLLIDYFDVFDFSHRRRFVLSFIPSETLGEICGSLSKKA